MKSFEGGAPEREMADTSQLHTTTMPFVDPNGFFANLTVQEQTFSESPYTFRKGGGSAGTLGVREALGLTESAIRRLFWG